MTQLQQKSRFTKCVSVTIWICYFCDDHNQLFSWWQFFLVMNHKSWLLNPLPNSTLVLDVLTLQSATHIIKVLLLSLSFISLGRLSTAVNNQLSTHNWSTRLASAAHTLVPSSPRLASNEYRSFCFHSVERETPRNDRGYARAALGDVICSSIAMLATTLRNKIGRLGTM